MLIDRSYKHKQLGIISLIGMAPAAGPAAPLVIATALAATFLPILFHLIGRGRSEADYLTKPNQGAQWIIENQTLPALIDPYTAIKESGQPFDVSYLQNLIAALDHVRDTFVDYAGKLPRAGPGAIATIVHVINDLLIPDVKRQFINVIQESPEALPAPEPDPVHSQPVLTEHPVIRVVQSGNDSEWMWLILAGLLFSVSNSKTKKGR